MGKIFCLISTKLGCDISSDIQKIPRINVFPTYGVYNLLIEFNMTAPEASAFIRNNIRTRNDVLTTTTLMAIE